MAIIVIFNTQTEEVLQTCRLYSDRHIAEDMADIIFATRGLDPFSYSVRTMAADMTTNEFLESCYISNGQPYEKSPMFCQSDKDTITANGVDKATISGCPQGATAYVDGSLIGTVGADGLVEVTSTVAKRVELTLEKFDYQKETVTINAT